MHFPMLSKHFPMLSSQNTSKSVAWSFIICINDWLWVYMHVSIRQIGVYIEPRRMSASFPSKKKSRCWYFLKQPWAYRQPKERRGLFRTLKKRSWTGVTITSLCVESKPTMLSVSVEHFTQLLVQHVQRQKVTIVHSHFRFVGVSVTRLTNYGLLRGLTLLQYCCSGHLAVYTLMTSCL